MGTVDDMAIRNQEEVLLSHFQDVVARKVVADIVESVVGEQWENYPDIAESDWIKIQKIALDKTQQLAPTGDTYRAAYRRLAERAERLHRVS